MPTGWVCYVFQVTKHLFFHDGVQKKAQRYTGQNHQNFDDNQACTGHPSIVVEVMAKGWV